MKKTSCEVRLGLCYLDGWGPLPCFRSSHCSFHFSVQLSVPTIEVYQCFHSLFH